jgi:hypothetical protein
MTHDEPMISSQADLCAVWEHLTGRGRFDHRSLWLMLVDPEGTPVPRVLEIDDLPQLPDDLLLDRLVEMCEHLVAEDGMRIAFLLSRPGQDGVSPGDRQWGRALVAAARRAGMGVLPTHRANDAGVLALAPDDLMTTGAA